VRRDYRVTLPTGFTTGYGWSGVVHLRRHHVADALCGALLLSGYRDAGNSLDDVTCGNCTKWLAANPGEGRTDG